MIDMDRMYTQLISKRKGSDKRGIAYEKKIWNILVLILRFKNVLWNFLNFVSMTKMNKLYEFPVFALAVEEARKKGYIKFMVSGYWWLLSRSWSYICEK